MIIDYNTCCAIIDKAELPGRPTNRPLAILPEIVGAFDGCSSVWLPFVESWMLARALNRIIRFNDFLPEQMETTSVPADGLYFGTPTIVNDLPLFDQPGFVAGLRISEWNKDYERYVVKHLAYYARKHGIKVVVCGLGSGDISVEERIEDMGFGVNGESAEVIAWKKFQGFQDWVIALRLAWEVQ